MPTKRILLTLGDMKELLACKYHCTPNEVEISNNDNLILDMGDGVTMPVGVASYLFQVNLEEEL